MTDELRRLLFPKKSETLRGWLEEKIRTPEQEDDDDDWLTPLVRARWPR